MISSSSVDRLQNDLIATGLHLIIEENPGTPASFIVRSGHETATLLPAATLDESNEVLLAQVAYQLQDVVVEFQRGQKDPGRPWPECPRHYTHPLTSEATGNPEEAWWVCSVDKTLVAPIGGLNRFAPPPP